MSVTLKAFLSGLATDCQKFAQFVSDPGAAIQSAGLSAEDAEALKSGNAATIKSRLGSISGIPTDPSCHHTIVWAAGTPGAQSPFPWPQMPQPPQAGPSPQMFLICVWPVGQPSSPAASFPFPWAPH
jgi:hypothetical protein